MYLLPLIFALRTDAVVRVPTYPRAALTACARALAREPRVAAGRELTELVAYAGRLVNENDRTSRVLGLTTLAVYPPDPKIARHALVDRLLRLMDDPEPKIRRWALVVLLHYLPNSRWLSLREEDLDRLTPARRELIREDLRVTFKRVSRD